MKAILFALLIPGLVQAQSRAGREAISPPVTLSIMALNIGLSDPVPFNLDYPGAAISEAVAMRIDYGNAGKMTSDLAKTDTPTNPSDVVKKDVTVPLATSQGSELKKEQDQKVAVDTKLKEQPSVGSINDPSKGSLPPTGNPNVNKAGQVAEVKKDESKSGELTVGVMEVKKDIPSTVVPVSANATKPKETVVKTAPAIAPEDPSLKETPGIPKYFALLIGVSSYKYASSQLSNLDEPVNDARKLETILIKKYEFSRANVKVLADPTRSEIMDELDRLARTLTDKDNLLIFYAGHGNWDAKAEVGYWLPADAKPDRKADWIPNSTLQDYINGIYSKHTLLISDACFGGSIFKTRGVDLNLSEFGISKIYSLPSRKAMTSGNLSNVPDKSKFLEYLVKRLDENEDERLPARILFDRIFIAVINNSNSVPLYGVVHSTGDEGGDFIFIRRK